jgi:hypothetical protein
MIKANGALPCKSVVWRWGGGGGGLLDQAEEVGCQTVDVRMEPVLGVGRTRSSSNLMNFFKQSWCEEASAAGVGDAYGVHREALS